jgi:hypothetical protein
MHARAPRDTGVPDASEASTLYAMGLLDDAIREHLDLKRRRGADPAEIERLEREALGPVRRRPESDPRDLAGAQGDELEPEWDDRFEEAPHSEPPKPSAEPIGHGKAPAYEPRETDVPREQHPEAHEGAAPPPTDESPRRGDETAEYDVMASNEGEDVLEETPEFLQDAPDHDRLWFEQRPPRDFDFDG